MGIDALEAMMNPNHPRKLRATAWADENLPSSADMQGRYVDREIWATAGRGGLLGIHVPAEHGGQPMDHVEAALVYEGLGASIADNGVVFAVASQAFAANKAVALAADPAQAARWLPGMASGELISSFAMSEPDAGSDPASIATTAIREGETWVLSGQKTWATLAPIADIGVVFASTDPTRGQWGISAFVVDLDTAGVTRSEPIQKLGLRSSPFGRITFDDCRVAAGALLGRVGSGAAIFRRVVEAERAFLYAAQIGAMGRVIDRCVDHARNRVQNGVHIGTHQAVSHRIVDMKLRHEVARLLLYRAAAAADRGASLTMPAALAKMWTADAAVTSMVDGMRTFGAAGYTEELELETEVRDALAGLSYSGTTDIARNVAAALLGLGRPA